MQNEASAQGAVDGDGISSLSKDWPSPVVTTDSLCPLLRRGSSYPRTEMTLGNFACICPFRYVKVCLHGLN
jgi:hypothetical protein